MPRLLAPIQKVDKSDPWWYKAVAGSFDPLDVYGGPVGAVRGLARPALRLKGGKILTHPKAKTQKELVELVKDVAGEVLESGWIREGEWFSGKVPAKTKAGKAIKEVYVSELPSTRAKQVSPDAVTPFELHQLIGTGMAKGPKVSLETGATLKPAVRRVKKP